MTGPVCRLQQQYGESIASGRSASTTATSGEEGSHHVDSLGLHFISGEFLGLTIDERLTLDKQASRLSILVSLVSWILLGNVNIAG